MLHIEKNMCTKRDKKQNTFKLTNTSNPHKIIVKLKVQTAYSDNQTDISHSVVNIHCINNSVCVPLFVKVWINKQNLFDCDYNFLPSFLEFKSRLHGLYMYMYMCSRKEKTENTSHYLQGSLWPGLIVKAWEERSSWELVWECKPSTDPDSPLSNMDLGRVFSRVLDRFLRTGGA